MKRKLEAADPAVGASPVCSGAHVQNAGSGGELASLGRWRLRPGQPPGSWADEDRGVRRPGRQNSGCGPGLSGPMASKSPSKGPREGEWTRPMGPEPPKTTLAGAVTWTHPGVVWEQQPQPLRAGGTRQVLQKFKLGGRRRVLLRRPTGPD